MKPSLRSRFERFCFQHKNAGIPNLMLILAIGQAIVYLFGYIDPSNVIYRFLCWDWDLILHGQVWRLVSYVFIPDYSNLLFLVIGLLFYTYLGKILEREWGTLRLTLYYFTGVILTDVAAIAGGLWATTSYLNMSLMLAFATLFPDNMVLLFMIIPLKFKYLAWFYFVMTALEMIASLVAGGIPLGVFSALLCLVPLLNYFLFFGKEIRNVLPFVKGNPVRRAQFRRQAQPKPNPGWADRRPNGEARSYHHKCTVCGRTDTDYPDLEFRYCSRCSGYYCYCEDHINNHVHIQS